MKRILTVYLLVLCSTFGFAQAVAYLSGKVTDTERQPVSNAFIKVQGTAYVTYSDVAGKYSLKVPAGKQIVMQLAYGDEIITSSLGPYDVGENYYKNFQFNKSFSLEGVVVGGDKLRNRPIITIAPKKIERFANAGSFERILPLVGLGLNTAGGDQGSAYSVRGGNFDENLVYVNGIEIYRPFLVRSGQQEGLSVINGDLVESINFSAGGFQAKYGDKLSSVLDIQYREPDSFRATFQASFLGANIHLEDKLGSRFSYLIGARFRSNQYLLGSLDVQGDYQPRFYDIQTLLKYKITNDLSLSYLTTLSQNRYLVTPQNRQTSFGGINSALSLFVAFGGQELMEYTTWMNGLNLEYKPSEELDITFNVSSYTTSEREHFTVEGAYRLSELDNNLGSDDFAEEAALLGIGYFIDHARNDLNAQVFAANLKGRYLSKKSNLQWGVGYTNERIEDRLKEWRYTDSSEYNITTRAKDNTDEIILDEFLKADISLLSFRVNGYVQNSQTLNRRNNLKTTHGIRSNYWSLNGENVISPLMLIVFQI
ncbi:MAG: TonB-dependent receptor [Bacteroidia bacterium]